MMEVGSSSQNDNEILDFSNKKDNSPKDTDSTPKPPFSLPEDLAKQVNMDTTIFAQKMMEQQLAANFPQGLPGLPNLPGVGNMPQLNTLEMLNLMQFHHLMSLNLMNLAPPLMFGAAGNTSAPPNMSSSGTSDTIPTPVAPPPVQLLQQQAQQAAQVKQNNKLGFYFTCD